MEDEDIILSEENRSKLDDIVKRMETNKESQEDIQFVVDDFKKKYGTTGPIKKKVQSEPTNLESPSTLGPTTSSLDSLSQSDPGVVTEQELFGISDNGKSTEPPKQEELSFMERHFGWIRDYGVTGIDPAVMRATRRLTTGIDPATDNISPLEETAISLELGLKQLTSGLLSLPNLLNKTKDRAIEPIVSKAADWLTDGTPEEKETFKQVIQTNLATMDPLSSLASESNKVQRQTQDLVAYTQGQQQVYEDGIIESFKKGKISDGFQQISNAIVTTAPNTALILSTGGTGLAISGGTAAGSRLSELEREVEEGRLEADSDNMLLNAYAYGSLDLASNLVLRGLGRANKELFKSLGREAVEENVKQSFKNVLLSTGSEGAEEMLTQLGSNAADILLLDSDKDLMENVLDAGVIGLANAGVISSPAITAYGTSTLMSKRERAKIEKADNAIRGILKSMSNTSDAETIEILGNLLNENKKTIFDTFRKGNETLNNLPDNLKEEVTKNLAEMANIKMAIDNPANVESLDQLQQSFNELKQDTLLRINNQANQSRLNSLPDRGLKLKEQAAKELMQEFIDKGETEFNISDEQINNRAIELLTQQKQEQDARLQKEDVDEEGKQDDVRSEEVEAIKDEETDDAQKEEVRAQGDQQPKSLEELPDRGLALKEEAREQLLNEAKEGGLENVSIPEPEVTKRANKLFEENPDLYSAPAEVIRDVNSNIKESEQESENSFEKIANEDNFTSIFTTKIVDKFDKFRKIQSKIEETRGGKIPINQDFSKAEDALYGKAANDLDKFSKRTDGIVKDIAKSSVNADDLSRFMYAKHAKERNNFIKENIDENNESGSGLTDSQADAIINEYQGEKLKELESLSKKFYDIIEDTRNILERSGLSSKKGVENLRNAYENYVPLKGFAQDESSGSEYLDVGAQLSVTGKESKRALGRKSEAGDVISNIIAQHTEAIVRARKNETLQTLYNQIKENPNPKVWRIYSEDNPKKTRALVNGKLKEVPVPMQNNPNFVGVKVDGKQFYLEFENKRLARILNAASIEKTDIINKTLGRFNRFLSLSLTTLNPEFVMTNFARDIQTAIYNQMAESDIGDTELLNKNLIKNTLKTTTKALPAIMRNELGRGVKDQELNKYYEEFKEDGAKTGWFYAKNTDQLKKDIDNTIELYNASKLSPKQAKKYFKSMLDFVDNVNTSVENAVRLASYVEARKAGVSREVAANYAKNLTVNFNRSGEYGSVANSLFLFFNAAVQGTARFAKAIAVPKKVVNNEGEISYKMNTAQKLAAGVTLFSGLLSMLNSAISDDDEDGTSFYMKIPDYEKERNMIIMNPVNGKDHFKIPLPYGYNIFNNIGTIMNEVGSGQRSAGDGLGFIVNSFVGAFSPINMPQSKDLDKKVVKTATPTILKPALELAINENHFGNSIYNENLPFGAPKPESSLGRKTTPEAFKNISKFLNEATGGSEYVSGAADINPDKIYHLFNFAIGGTGKFISEGKYTTTSLIDYINGVPVDFKANKIPFLGKVYGEPSEFVNQDTYYERRKEVSQLLEELKNNPDKKGDKKYKGIPQLKGLSSRVDKELSRLSKLRDKYSTIEDPIEKATKLNEVEKKYYKTIAIFNKKYNKLRK